MKVIASLLFLTTGHFCLAGSDTNIIATSEWSKPVSTNYEQTLRCRMLIAQGHSPAHAGTAPETEVYLELQNVSGAAGAPMKIYFDPGRGLRCEVLDANGKPPPLVGGGGSGGGAGACWITLPYDSTIRLRANMFGYGRKEGDGLLIQMSPPNMQRWDIQASDANVYFMSGTFTVTTPPNHIAKDFDETRSIWSGTLELPKMKLPVSKP
jgi:hypothetical protein